MKIDNEMDVIMSGFRAWAEQQPADKPYDWYAIRNCAQHQYLRAVGYPIGIVGAESGIRMDKVQVSWRTEYADAARERPHTFGALAERLAASGL